MAVIVSFFIKVGVCIFIVDRRPTFKYILYKRIAIKDVVDILQFEIIKLFIARMTSNKGVIHKVQTQREGRARVKNVIY